MKRAGFTMIELIFVIVILGILSAVALPKFIGVSDQAKAGKCKAFVGTLNRTVLPAIWSDAVLNDSANISSHFNEGNLTAQVAFPSDCNTSANFAKLLEGNGTVSVTYGSSVYDINLSISPSTNESPILTFTKH